MRLKQVTGILMLSFATYAMAASGASQLTAVGVQKTGDATTLTLRASGAFTHTEYRPTDNLLLVDLAGVSAGKWQDKSADLHGEYPGVESYRVVTYKGANGAEITRLELTVASDANVGVTDREGGLAVNVSSKTAHVPSAAPAPAVVAVKSAPAKPAAVLQLAAAPKTVTHARPGAVAHIRSVSVARSADGLNVEIAASGAIEPHTMRLSGPDRIVIDVPNAVSARKNQTIAVNSEGVKEIRVAHYSVHPPSTRIVVDLAQMHEFEMASNGAHAVLKIHSAEMAKATTAPQAAATPAPQPVSVAAQPAASVAAPAVLTVAAKPMTAQFKPAAMTTMVEPKVTTRPATPEEAAEVASQQPSRADIAASHFADDQPQVPVSNKNASIRPETLNQALLQQRAAAATNVESAPTTCNTGKYNGEPISVNLKEVDLRDFFRLIHEISGLNVVLDPQVKGSLTMVLDDVPWDQALSIVLKNNGLDCQLEGNVLRIATTSTLKAEADSRRAQQEAEMLAVNTRTITRYLSYAKAADVLPTVKQFLSQRGTVIADQRTNALIISDIPNVLPNVDSLIKQLDLKTPEVEIEARVVASTRNFARDIGTQLGFGVGSNTWAVGGPPSNATSGIISGITNPNYIVKGGEIPLFSNFPAGSSDGLAFINATSNYRLDFVLTAAESRGLLKILSRPRVVTQNNQAALIRQGTQIPVVTPGQLGGPASVQYVAAFLRLQVTPQITNDGTIFMNIDVENTVPDTSFSVGSNPALLTQQATTQVLVNDGGTLVIGGVMQTQSSVAISQMPLLGDIPLLGNLFKRRNVSTNTQELIFFITPRIIQT